MSISEDLKNIFLAGIGAVATTAEKSKEVIDELVSKGEITIKQGKLLNEELKNNIKNTFDNTKDEMAEEKQLINKIMSMSPEEIATLKEKISEIEEVKKDDC